MEQEVQHCTHDSNFTIDDPVQSSLQLYSIVHTSEACLFTTFSDQCITCIVCSPLYATRNLSFYVSFAVLLGSVIYPSTMYCNSCSLCCPFRILRALQLC